MIKIWIDESKTRVKLEVNPGMRNGNVMYFYWECGTEWYAELMQGKLRDQLSDELKRIRSTEYENGWKDAKRKKAKRQFFSGGF